MYTLQSTGFETKGFEDGYSFFEELKEEKPDLILLDVMLPDEDGISILTKLKKNPDTSDIPIIIASAKGEEYDKIKGLDTGAKIIPERGTWLEFELDTKKDIMCKR